MRFTIYDSLVYCFKIGFDRSAFAARPVSGRSRLLNFRIECTFDSCEGLLELPIKNLKIRVAGICRNIYVK